METYNGGSTTARKRRGSVLVSQQVVLTERRTEVLKDAVRLGYYEFPRKINLTNLSKFEGVARSTASELLRGAELYTVENTNAKLTKRQNEVMEIAKKKSAQH